MIYVNKKGIFAIVGVAVIIILVFAVPQPTETPRLKLSWDLYSAT